MPCPAPASPVFFLQEWLVVDEEINNTNVYKEENALGSVSHIATNLRTHLFCVYIYIYTYKFLYLM